MSCTDRCDRILAVIDHVFDHDDTDLCDHEGEGRVVRRAHGCLGDAPAGTLQTLCAGCGTVLNEATGLDRVIGVGQHGPFCRRSHWVTNERTGDEYGRCLVSDQEIVHGALCADHAHDLALDQED